MPPGSMARVPPGRSILVGSISEISLEPAQLSDCLSSEPRNERSKAPESILKEERVGSRIMSPQVHVPPPVARKGPKNWLASLRWGLLLLGGLTLYLLINKLGLDKVSDAIFRAGAWLPLVFFLDLLWLSVEGLALRRLYGAAVAKIPLHAWIYSSLVHYVTFMLAPMGRVGSEAARASFLARYVGSDRATVGAALMQSFTMLTNATISLVAVGVVISIMPKSALVLAIWGNLLTLCAFGLSSYLVMRHIKLGGFLGRRFSKLAEAGPSFDAQFRASRSDHVPALGICLLSRSIQVLQYGVILLSVSGNFSWQHAWIAEGIQLVARSAGDMIPNQMGVSEGMFTLFRAPLGLKDAATVALSVALVARVSNLSMAAFCALLVHFWPKRLNPALAAP